MDSIAENLAVIRDYLKKTEAPEDVMASFAKVTDGFTIVMGYLLRVSEEIPTEDRIQ